MRVETTPVLVVGGGLVGLSAALFLAARGVAPLLVERRPASAPHPRAIGYTARTMELFRSVGLERAIPSGGAGTARGAPCELRDQSLNEAAVCARVGW